MAISVVGTQTGSNPATTSPISYTVSGAGNNIILMFGSDLGVTAVSGAGGTWTRVVYTIDGTGYGAVDIWLGTGCSSGLASISYTSGDSVVVYELLEYSGGTSGAADASNSAVRAESISVTTLQAGDLVVACMADLQNAITSPGSPWTGGNADFSGTPYFGWAYQVVGSAGSYTASFSASSYSIYTSITIAAFKAASGGGSGPIGKLRMFKQAVNRASTY